METLKINFERFCEYIAENITKYLPAEYKDVEVKIVRTEKPNVCETQLSIFAPGGSYGINYTLNNMYGAYTEGTDLNILVSEIAYKISRFLTEGLAVPDQHENIFNRERILSTVRVKLVNLLKNTSFLADKPYYEPVKGLAGVFTIPVDDIKEGGVVTLTKRHLEGLGITAEELVQAATDNMANMPYSLVDMRDMMIADAINNGADPSSDEFKEWVNDLSSAVPMYVLSNLKRVNGASVMLSTGVMNELAEKFGEFILMPADIDELIMIPLSAVLDDADYLTEIVKDVNSNVVSPSDYLSDDIYKYANGTLSIWSEAVA